MFALKYGQMNIVEEEKVRKNFKGQFVRSIVDDFMNDKSESRGKVLFRMTINYLVALGFLCVSASLTIVILYVKHIFYHDKLIPIIKLIEINQLIWNTVECFKNFFINIVFLLVLKRLIVWENHKYISDHQKSLINISFFFLVTNTFMPFVIILFGNAIPISTLVI